MAIDRSTSHTPSPIYGIRPGLNVGDLYSTGAPVVALTAIGVNTTSAALPMGARAIEISCLFSTAVTVCDLVIFRVDPGPVDTQVLVITGAKQGNANFFVGGFEAVQLDGLNVKVRAQNFTGGGTVAINVRNTG